MIKYSVIGTSWITKSFVDGASLCNELVLDGVYSRSAQKGEAFAKETGAQRVFNSFDDLLQSDTELVYVASPNVCHYAQCKNLLDNGKHVICEKPITITSDEFSRLASLAREKNLVYFEAIMYMHSPARAVLKDSVAKIGNIRSASIDFSQLSSKYKALVNGELPNIFNPEMKTGALNDLGIYCVYPVVDLFGVPQDIIPSQHLKVHFLAFPQKLTLGIFYKFDGIFGFITHMIFFINIRHKLCFFALIIINTDIIGLRNASYGNSTQVTENLGYTSALTDF